MKNGRTVSLAGGMHGKWSRVSSLAKPPDSENSSGNYLGD
jgi:hypothetical protein